MISDSMIALHDDAESIKSFVNNTEINIADRSSSEWLNDWDQDDKSFNLNRFRPMTSASLVSLQGSINTSCSVSDVQKNQKISHSLINDSMGAEFDIKSIKIDKKLVHDPQQELIENYLNDMKPNLESKKSVDIQLENKHIESNKKENLWDCEDEINFDEL